MRICVFSPRLIGDIDVRAQVYIWLAIWSFNFRVDLPFFVIYNNIRLIVVIILILRNGWKTFMFMHHNPSVIIIDNVCTIWVILRQRYGRLGDERSFEWWGFERWGFGKRFDWWEVTHPWPRMLRPLRYDLLQDVPTQPEKISQYLHYPNKDNKSLYSNESIHHIGVVSTCNRLNQCNNPNGI